MFTVYSKPACPACDQAKALLEAKGLQYDVISLDIGQPKIPTEKYITRDELLAKIPGARTIPQIFQDGQYIGGFTELKTTLRA